MAKERDRLFIEQNIGEKDIEKAIDEFKLEDDQAFCDLMKKHD